VLADAVGPEGQVLAVDRSLKMVSQLRRVAREGRRVVPIVADAVKLPFGSGCFDGSRADRVLQHLAAPREAVGELVRVTRPGGRVVTAEPDWSTLSLREADTDLTRQIVRYGCESIPSGRVGPDTGRMLVDAGLQDVSVREVALVTETFEDADRLYRLRDFVQGAVRERRVPSDAAAGWIATLDNLDASRDFSGSLTMFLATGVRPS